MLYKRKEENGLNQSHIYIIEGVCCFCCTEGYSMLAFFEKGEKEEEEAQQHRFRISPCSAPDDAGSTGR
jgi:hypothetical protein